MDDLFKAHVSDHLNYEQYPQNEQNNSLGSYYKQGDIEVIDFIDAYNLNFNLGNAIKYIARCNYKSNMCPNCCMNSSDKVNDLRKAIWYIEREIEKSTQHPATCKTDCQ